MFIPTSTFIKEMRVLRWALNYKKLKKAKSITLVSKICPSQRFFLVTSNLPWFFQYEYEYDCNGNISGYDYTSLFLDETLYYFWILWQFLVHTLVPFIVLLIINFLILWKLTSPKQSLDGIKGINQIDGLRRHTR